MTSIWISSCIGIPLQISNLYDTVEREKHFLRSAKNAMVRADSIIICLPILCVFIAESSFCVYLCCSLVCMTHTHTHKHHANTQNRIRNEIRGGKGKFKLNQTIIQRVVDFSYESAHIPKRCTNANSIAWYPVPVCVMHTRTQWIT